MSHNSLLNLIRSRCHEAVSIVYPELINQPIDVTLTNEPNGKFGDYQFNSSMKFSKILKQSPLVISQKLVDQLNLTNIDPQLFATIAIAGPGFINFSIADEFLVNNLKTWFLQQKFCWDLMVAKHPIDRDKIIVDFSSPNIAKEMHVGHLRSTIIGDCISRIFEDLGHVVVRLNHLGDWGTQFGMLIAYLKQFNYQDQALTIMNLDHLYRQAKLLFDQDPMFKQQSQQQVIALQSYDPQAVSIWKKICDISGSAYQEIYNLLGVNIVDRPESFYNWMLPEVVQDFTNKNLLVDSAGAKCIYLEDFIGREQKLLPLIIQKSDGGYNYATTDLAAIKYRVAVDQAKKIIYVTDRGQSLHFNMVFAAALKVGYIDASIKLIHVPLGLVLRKDGKKFKTREGNTFKLKDLIDEAVNKAKQLLLERNPNLSALELDQASKIMGINAIKYADLSTNRNSDYMFDLDQMLQFQGNTAAFLAYAYVRIRSIQKKVQFDYNQIKDLDFTLSTIVERKLALTICRLPEVINSVAEELLPNRLTDYLYLLAEEFHGFFQECKVIGSEWQNQRVLLCELVAKVLTIGFDLLGLSIIEKM